MKINHPRRRGGLWSLQLDASDFPVREMIEPKLAKLRFELAEGYVGKSTNPFLAEALTTSPQVILRALSLSHFEFEGSGRLAGSIESTAWGVRFGYANLNEWNAFYRVAIKGLSKQPELSQAAYAAYLYSKVNQDRRAGLQIAAVVLALTGSGKSPVLSHSQIELFLRLREKFGSQLQPAQMARLITGFTFVEALELLDAELSVPQLDDVLEIRCDFGHDASVAELISMLGTAQHRWLQTLMA